MTRTGDALAVEGGVAAVRRPLTPFSGIGAEERAAVAAFMEGGEPLSGFHGSARPTFFGGAAVQRFEKAWASRFGVAHAVSMNSATSGLIAAVAAAGIGPGDEVIVAPYSMSASAIAPLFYGGVPVFADIDPDTFCLDPARVEAAITPHTRAIIAVNLFGHPAPLKRLRALADARGLTLIEDSAQATLAHEDGALTGTVGHIGVYSLNVHKHIHAGEGGVCVTQDPRFAQRLQLIRNHGENVTEWLGVEDLTNLIGFNFRLPELSAVIAEVQLSKIDVLVERAERIAARLTAGVQGLRGLTPPTTRAGCRHNFYMWSCKVDAAALGTNRAAFSRALAAEGFVHSVGYVRPIYLLPMFQQRRAVGREGFPFTLRHRHYPIGLCPVVERMHDHELLQFQPVSWDVDDAQVDMLVEAIRKVHRQADRLPPA